MCQGSSPVLTAYRWTEPAQAETVLEEAEEDGLGRIRLENRNTSKMMTTRWQRKRDDGQRLLIEKARK